MVLQKVNVGVVGCGNISSIYLEVGQSFEILNIVAVADLIHDRARSQAEKYHIPRTCSVQDILDDPSIEFVLNLTTPDAHATIAQAALEAGKSVYNEKPLAIKRQDAEKMLTTAHSKNLLVGCAPDTFLGGGLQTCRKIIEDGWIGQPVAATAFMLCHGHESWHPSPEFYYQVGGGPLFDMGPYYLTALIALIGPVTRVTGSGRITFPARTITSQPKYGKQVKVEVPTHIAGVLDFSNGAIATLVTSFDVWAAEVPHIEIYGSRGSLSVPDPNGFTGPVRIRQPGDEEWREIPLTHGYTRNSRSIGLADMATAWRTGRLHRANGELAFHVLDIMHTIHEASAQGKHIQLSSTCLQPAPLPLGLQPGKLDE